MKLKLPWDWNTPADYDLHVVHQAIHFDVVRNHTGKWGVLYDNRRFNNREFDTREEGAAWLELYFNI